MAQGKALSEETKAAVMASLLAGQSVCEVAKAYQISKSTVSGLRGSVASDIEQLQTQKRDRIGELLGDYVECNLITLKAQSEHFRDKAWLNKQPASELAVLHGVVADKTIRILEASEATTSE